MLDFLINEEIKDGEVIKGPVRIRLEKCFRYQDMPLDQDLTIKKLRKMAKLIAEEFIRSINENQAYQEDASDSAIYKYWK
jgi:hypothetical protein